MADTGNNKFTLDTLPRVNFAEPFYTSGLKIFSVSYGSSILLHALVYLSLWFFGYFSGYTPKGIEIDVLPPAPAGETPYKAKKPDEERISKFFRLDFIPTLDARRVKWIEPEKPEPPKPEPIPVEPEEPDEPIEDESGLEIEIALDIEGVDYQRPGTKTYSYKDPENVKYIIFPQITMPDVFREDFNPWNLFGEYERGGRRAVFIFCDVSREGGYKDLTDWAEIWVGFLQMRGLGDLPHVICVGGIIENPYVYSIEYYETGLKLLFEDYREQIEHQTEKFEVTGLIDLENEILRDISDQVGENILELKKPLIMLVDNWGVVRIMMWGRPVDITTQEFDQIGSVVREMWYMTDAEFMFFKTVLLAKQAQLRRAEGWEPSR